MSVLAVSPATAQRAADQREDLRRRTEDVRRQLGLARASDAKVDAEVARLNTEVRAQQARAEAAGQAEAAARQAMAANERRMAEVAARLERTRARMVESAVNAYVRPQPTFVDVVMDSDNINQATWELALLRTGQASAQDLLDEFGGARKDLAGARQDLARAKDVAAGRARQQATALTALDRSRDEQKLAQAELDKRLSHLEDQEEGLLAQQAAIEQILRSEAAAREAQLARQRAAKAAQAAAPRAPAPAPGARRPATAPAPSSPSSSGFIWPLQGTVTSEFGPRWGRMHNGIDIADPAGTPIASSKDGVVAFAGWMDGYGNFVIVDHGGGLSTAYGHQSRLAVSKGADVDQGQTVGYVGSTGNSTGNHLHFEVRVNGSARNPRGYLP